MSAYELLQAVVFAVVPAVQVPLPVLVLAGLAVGWLLWELRVWRRHR